MQREQLIDGPRIATIAARTDQDTFIRNVLWAAAFFNVVGAVAFGFPETVGRLAGLPGNVPAVYAAMVSLFILLFGGAYAWLARSPVIDRPLLAFGAIGKTAAFLTVATLWLAGEVPFIAVFTITGDLVFAIVFARWLLATRETAGR
jgi:hypothetical protein